VILLLEISATKIKKVTEEMGRRLEDRVAIITGSGRGIGRAIALTMAKEGARVVTNDCDPGVAEAVTSEITDSGGQAVSFVGDVSRFEVARKLMQAAVDNFGGLDILVNNAGITGHNPIWDMTENEWDNLLVVNLKSTFNCIRHACVIMKEQGWGRIINATSSARLGIIENCNYCAAKAGIVGLTKGVAMDLGSYGITCNTYAPTAATRTCGNEEQRARTKREYELGIMTKEFYEIVINPPPPETIAPLLIYLCTDEAADINGQVFDILGQRIRIFTEEAKNRIAKEEGLWTVEELAGLVPKVLLKGIEVTLGRLD
jgi:3-oxoacyl-[acyl-carrier protein] reductase